MIARVGLSMALLAIALLILAIGVASARRHPEEPTTPSVVTTLGTQGP